MKPTAANLKRIDNGAQAHLLCVTGDGDFNGTSFMDFLFDPKEHGSRGMNGLACSKPRDFELTLASGKAKIYFTARMTPRRKFTVRKDELISLTYNVRLCGDLPTIEVIG